MDKQLEKKVQEEGQGQILQFMTELSEEAQKALEAQIRDIDFGMILAAMQGEEAEEKTDVISPFKTMTIPEIMEQKDYYRTLGEEALRKGEVAAVILAGGQGSRLGFDGPKGTLNIGITKELYLFECLLHNIRLNMKDMELMPVYIMTSDQNHEATVNFFAEHDAFGYPKEKIRFFKQSMAPALSLEGKILLADRGHLCLAPNGNGGWFRSLQQQGLTEEMKREGIHWLNVVSVDNVLQNIGDPVFLGATIAKKLSAGAKVIAKVTPEEKVGAICLRNGRPSVVEYSELTEEMREAKGENGQYLYHYGVTLNYLFHLEETEERAKERLPIHKAKKKITYMDSQGNIIHPEEPNAYKLEYFIFDILEFYEDVLSYEVVREDEFAPIKNRMGVDSLDTARELLVKKTGIEL